MEVFLVITVILLLIFAAIKGSEKPKAIENKDIPVLQTKEKRVVLIKEDKSMLLKYSLLFVVFSLCLRFIVLPAVPTKFLVEAELSNSSYKDFKIRHDCGYSHIKLDHDWPSYKSINIENKK